MAVIDSRDDCVVIRVVYDGVPMAGKTTSVATLGRGLGAGVYSPADLDGRTLYFDWLDYTGGLFEGRRIRCQIVSVPGQVSLARRRRRLLASADVIVYVSDSSPAGVAADRRYLAGLRDVLQKIDGPPLGIVLQANKRDLPDATPLPTLRAMLEELELRSAIIESVATQGSGIRETFVFAVRLALDRVRELARTGALLTAQPKINSAADLLQDLQKAEREALDLAIEAGNGRQPCGPEAQPASLAAQAFEEAMRTNLDSPGTTNAAAHAREQLSPVTAAFIPAPPDATVASGMVWPPVDGRLILHETSAGPVTMQRDSDGGWLGTIGDRWRLHSARQAVFDDVEAGRTELVEWARRHVAGSELLSKQRCIVLANDGGGRFRLWQIVRIAPSLRTQMEQALSEDAATLADTLLAVARSFVRMADRMSGAICELQLTLGTIGASSLGSNFLGFVPTPSLARPVRTWSPAQAAEQLVSELSFARPTLRARRSDLLTELARLARPSEKPPSHEWHLLQRLAALTRE